MTRPSARERLAQLSWEQQKRQTPCQRRVLRLLRELRNRMADPGSRQLGDVDRYRAATSEAHQGCFAHALGVLTAEKPPAPLPEPEPKKRGILISWPGLHAASG